MRTLMVTTAILGLNACAFTQSTPSGVPYSWGAYSAPYGADVIEVAQSAIHAVALNRDGSLRQWGPGFVGLIGTPPSITNGVKIAAAPSNFWSVVVKSDKTLASWGTVSGAASAPDVSGVTGAVDVSAADNHLLILKDDGTVQAIGDESGTGETAVPEGLDHVASICATGNGSIAVKDDGTVVAWGTLPVSVATVESLTDVKEIAGGDQFIIALKNDGSVVKLGSDTNVSLANLPTIKHISACYNGAMFIGVDGSVNLRGLNANSISWGTPPAGLTNVKKGSLGPFDSVVIFENLPTLQLSSRDTVGGATGGGGFTAKIVLASPALESCLFTVTSTDPSFPTKTVKITTGQTEGTINAVPGPVSSNVVVKLTATGNLGTSISRFTNRAPAVQSIVLDKTTSLGAESFGALLSLNSALDAETTVYLSSSDQSVSLPGSLTLEPGQGRGAFTVTVDRSTVLKKVTIFAYVGNTAPAKASILIPATPTVRSMSFGSSMYGNQLVYGTINLAQNAPMGGTDVELTVSAAELSVPISVHFLEGERSRTFEIFGADVNTALPVTVTASTVLGSVNRTITIKPNDLAAFTLAPSVLTGGGTTEGTVTLRAVVARDTRVEISSPSASVTVPHVVVIPAGSKTATFEITTAAVTKRTTVKLTAGRHGLYRAINLTLNKG